MAWFCIFLCIKRRTGRGWAVAAGDLHAVVLMIDILEEVVRMKRAGERGALATIVNANGSIPSYESSRMLVRDDGSTVGTVGGGCV